MLALAGRDDHRVIRDMRPGHTHQIAELARGSPPSPQGGGIRAPWSDASLKNSLLKMNPPIAYLAHPGVEKLPIDKIPIGLYIYYCPASSREAYRDRFDRRGGMRRRSVRVCTRGRVSAGLFDIVGFQMARPSSLRRRCSGVILAAMRGSKFLILRRAVRPVSRDEG